MSCCQLYGCGASCCVCCLCAACAHGVLVVRLASLLGLLLCGCLWRCVVGCWECCGCLSCCGAVGVCAGCAAACRCLSCGCPASVGLLSGWGVSSGVSAAGGVFGLCVPACWLLAAVRCAAAVAVGVGAGGASVGASFRRCACQTCGGCGASVLWLLLVWRCCCCAVPLMMSAAVLLAVVLRCCGCGCCCRCSCWLAVGAVGASVLSVLAVCWLSAVVSFSAGGKRKKEVKSIFEKKEIRKRSKKENNS